MGQPGHDVNQLVLVFLVLTSPYAVFMRRMAAREEDQTLSPTEKQQEFEDIFGPADDAFQAKFLEYIFSLQPRRSAIGFLR